MVTSRCFISFRVSSQLKKNCDFARAAWIMQSRECGLGGELVKQIGFLNVRKYTDYPFGI